MYGSRGLAGFGFGNLGGPDIAQVYERNQEATLYVGNVDPLADDDLLWELFTQAGPVKAVSIPRDKVSGAHQGYCFVEFENESDADYGLKLMNMVKLFGKPLRINKASQDKRSFEVGANLFVGNLDPEVDEKVLFDTFVSFGNIVSTKVMRDAETNQPKGYGFVSFDAFEASDAALASMNGQFLCNRPIHVSYAYKKDTRGERHGSAAERLIAANRPMPERQSVLDGPVPLQQGINTGVRLPMAPPPPLVALPQNPGSAPVINIPGMPPLPMPPMMGMGIPPGLPPPPLFFMPRPTGMPFIPPGGVPPNPQGMVAPPAGAPPGMMMPPTGPPVNMVPPPVGAPPMAAPPPAGNPSVIAPPPSNVAPANE